MFRTWSVFLFFSVVLSVSLGVCLFVCEMKIDNVKEATVTLERIRQREILEKILESVNLYKNEIERQAQVLGSAESIRIFAQDSKDYDLSDMAERTGATPPHELILQGEYLSRRFNAIFRQGMFDGAALFYPNGETMLSGPRSMNIEDFGIVRKAGREGEPGFGPLEKDSLSMLYALPILNGEDEGKPIGSLVLNINMERPFRKFLSMSEMPAVIFVSGGFVSLKEGAIVFSETQEKPAMTFGKYDWRGTEVYSTGGKARDLDWEVFVQEPASVVMERIRENEISIYAGGIAGAFAVSLVLTFLWIWWRGKIHSERAEEIQSLYETVSAQKALLDSVNASLKAGIVLCDVRGRILVANPAFADMAHMEIEPGTNMAEVFQGVSGVGLLEKMSLVNVQNKNIDLEMMVGEVGETLYRVSLLPYTGRDGGCVAVFSDITEFRKNALLARERRSRVTFSLIRAIESVDPLLVGRSQHMLELAEKYAVEMGMDEDDAETLRFSAILSQAGRIFLPREIFIKKGLLTENERDAISKIPEYSDRLLAELSLDLPVRETVSEMWNISTGKIRPENASLLAQILAIINVYAALMEDRPWREKKTEAEAVAELEKQFPQELVRILEK